MLDFTIMNNELYKLYIYLVLIYHEINIRNIFILFNTLFCLNVIPGSTQHSSHL